MADKLSSAVQLIKSGNKQAALPILREIIQENPNNEDAWLWMYACVDQTEQKKYCLQKVLEINPGNQRARKALGKLTEPGPEPVQRSTIGNTPRRKRGSRLWMFVLGAILLLIVCVVPSIYLAQTGQISSLAASVPLFPSATSTLTITPTSSATPSPTLTLTLSPTHALTPTLTVTPTPTEVTEISWFIGLDFGFGLAESQMKAEQAVVDDFNASQGFIHLSLQSAPFPFGEDKFTSEIVSGIGPDIVGPVDFVQTNSFHGQWLDLSPYVSPADLQPYNPALAKIYETSEGLVSLPFAVSPAALFYNTSLFDEAGLKYPPAHYGEKYEMPDGSQVEWSWDTLASVARLLTLDSKGRNATQEGFDRTKIIQYGYSWGNRPHPNKIGSFWGSGTTLAEHGNTAQIPPAWRTAWEWTYNAIWGEQPFMPNRAGLGSSFDNGKVAMNVQAGWAMCCNVLIQTWDLAAIPSYQGQVHGRTDVQSFHIWKGSKHPKEAYLVMLYLLNTGIQKLMTNEENLLSPPYTSLPAHTDRQQVWIEAQKFFYPSVTNWQVLIDGLDYPDAPHAQSYMPRFLQSWDVGSTFYTLLVSQPNLDLAVEEQNYLDQLNILFSFNR